MTAPTKHERRVGIRAWALWLALALVVLALTGLITHSDTQSQVSDASQQQRQATCAAQKIGRDALRLVIKQAYATNSPRQLPPDPTVDPHVIDYIQRLVNAQSGGSAVAAQRDRLLAAVPEYVCTADGVLIPKTKPVPPPSTPPGT